MIAVWLMLAGVTTSRSDLAELLIKHQQDRPPLFQSTPITHIVPDFNTVTYAIDANWINSQIEPPAGFWSSVRGRENLEYSGWVTSPYFALSLKKIGIGFNIEAGNKTLNYSTPSWNNEQQTQISSVDYRGLGIYVFYKPYETNEFATSITLGGKSLNARHEYGNLLTDEQRSSQGASKGTKYSYGIYDYALGMNAQLRLVKTMTIIPWADYSWLDDAAAHAAVKNLNEYGKKDFNDDLEIFWHDRPPLNYGIDFAVQLADFEIRLGGLLGSIVATGSTSEQISDKGLRIAFAWNQKG